ncbi:AzlD domain-containing protein [Acinetobacter sp. V110_1]|uniref:AzlD domain-containing protein n=1 Tax=Acinetobacter sp. V110_1 TaxID=3072988 RepID=UPI00287E0970|nr:AzlD domain-containing protein [Acinetobacter sp. V110_1]MDS7942470.1 AzlD domain-containing protein [Acinetobacter sp. V110_1]
MSWFMILGVAVIVFFNRYYFLEPNLKVKLPALMNKMLNYSAPCLLSAISIPVIFFERNELRGTLDNPYLYATVFCIVIAFYFKKILPSVLLSLAFFYFINFLINQ